MGRIFIDGGESGSLCLWDFIQLQNATPAISTVQKECGNYSIYIGFGSIKYLRKDISGISTIHFKLHLWIEPSATYSKYIASFWNNNGVQITVMLDTANKVVVRRGDQAGTILGTSIASFPNQTWCLLEGKLVIADSGGIAQIKMDGILEVDFTGDTRNQASDALITNVRLGNPYATSTNGYYVDNFSLDDAEWIGNTRIQAKVVNGAGNSTQFTPSSGQNWENVDEIPPNDADHVSGNANDLLDLYTGSSLIGSVNSIRCVQVQARCNKEGSPTPQNLKLACRTNNTNYLSSSKGIPTTTISLSHIWQNNPNTSSPWSIAEVNALEIGQQSAA